MFYSILPLDIRSWSNFLPSRWMTRQRWRRRFASAVAPTEKLYSWGPALHKCHGTSQHCGGNKGYKGYPNGSGVFPKETVAFLCNGERRETIGWNGVPQLETTPRERSEIQCFWFQVACYHILSQWIVYDTCMHACMQASRHTCIQAYMHTGIHICILYIYTHIYIYVYINVCIYGLQADYTYMNYKSLTNWDAPGRNAAAQGIWTWPCRNALCQSWESRSRGRHVFNAKSWHHETDLIMVICDMN